MTSTPVAIPGRVKTVVVFDAGGQPVAAVCDLTAKLRRENAPRRVNVAGLVSVDGGTLDHLERHVVPIVDGIAGVLMPRYRPRVIELSAVNLGAASTRDIAVHLAGFSADGAVFTAVLSAVLNIPLRRDVAVTGHLASTDGELRPVRALVAKLTAAANDPSVRTFLVPALDADASLRTMTPVERRQIQTAIAEVGRRLRVVQVVDVAQLVREVFSDEAVVIGSLKSGFFEPSHPLGEAQGAVDGVIHFLAAANDERFWATIERYLMAGGGTSAHKLLLLRARYQMRGRRYPQGFGLRLSRLVASLPPTTRRLKNVFPLLAKDVTLKLVRLARGEDFDDIQHLLPAVSGSTSGGPKPPPAAAMDTEPTALAGVDAVLAEISETSLAERTGKAIDTARATFVLPAVTAASYEEFLDCVAAFHASLLRHTGSPLASADDETVRADSLALLEQTFSERGGIQAAWAEGRDGMHGGMRVVLDLLTEQFRREAYARHVHYVLATAVDPLDLRQRVGFMSALLQRLGPHLPAEIRSQPPRRYARHYGLIIESYVRSLDRVNQLLRTL